VLDDAELKVINASEAVEWSRRFSSPIAHARFSGPDSVIAQTGFFSTEMLDVRKDTLMHPVIDEASTFTADTRSDTVLLSSLSADRTLTLSRSFFWDPPNVGVYYFTVWDTATGKPVSDRIRLVDNVALDQIAANHAEFSTDGRFLLFGRSGEDAKPDITDTLQLVPPDPILPVIADLAEALGGLRLKADGNLEPVTLNPSVVLEKLKGLLEAK
jgi:hypothetical protein